MSANRLPFAMTVAFGLLAGVSLAGFSEAGAVPASIGASLGREKAPVVKVDYYYPGYYRYRYDHRYGRLEDTPLAILTIPGKILGTAFGALAEGLTGAPYANPNFADPFYAPYSYDRDAYYNDRNWDRFGSASYYEDGSYGWPRYRREHSYRDRFDYDERASYEPRGYAEASYYDKPYYDGPSYRASYNGWSYRDYGSSYARGGEAACEREFRSFDPETGTYLNRYGERLFCPYLRP